LFIVKNIKTPLRAVWETKFQGELSTSFSGGYWEGHRAAAAGGQPIFFLFAITFPVEFDVWGRLCTHFEGAKVMTFAPVAQHFSRLNNAAFVTHKKKTYFWERMTKP